MEENIKRAEFAQAVLQYIETHNTAPKGLKSTHLQKVLIAGAAPFKPNMEPNETYFYVCKEINVEPRDFMSTDELKVYESWKEIINATPQEKSE